MRKAPSNRAGAHPPEETEETPFYFSVVPEEMRRGGVPVDLYKISSAIAACVIPWNTHLFFSFYSSLLVISLFLEGFSFAPIITAGVRAFPLLGIGADAVIRRYPASPMLLPVPLIFLSHFLYVLGGALKREDLFLLGASSLLSVSLVLGRFEMPGGRVIYRQLEELEGLRYLLKGYLGVLVFLAYQAVYVFLIINKKSGKYFGFLSLLLLGGAGALLFIGFHRVNGLLEGLDRRVPAFWREERRIIGQSKAANRSTEIRILQEELHKSPHGNSS